ncbi:MAG: class I SAM-dependent methyltransferase [Candidatus Margulisiibacteriota bacterium]
MTNSKCPLCSAPADFFCTDRGINFFKCGGCHSVFRDPNEALSQEAEKNRYELHNNDVNDPGYRTFIAPIVDAVLCSFSLSHTGLDFGAGPIPNITNLLREKGYNISPYDPFFHDDPKLLEKAYDYIVACEVIEHFRSPANEFKLLRSRLNPGGALICMTELYTEKTDFSKWTYKNDLTHRFFYSREALEWIRGKYGFSKSENKGRLLIFTV